ncbi:ABC transporter permease/M1 family aminopeptidase [Rufibacter roseus]|uniref:ABC transporter permease/M1 family aminopeptidase n=1 Tax=Rufibacter roseus TaxID=1567108 RepID=A0ABW2DI37_9BACT|nr:M1 family aminopeptidase [Rufibacter roseus]
MFFNIFLFELKYRLKRPATYIYFALFFLMTVLVVFGVAGVFGNPIIMGGGSSTSLKSNSPYQISMIITILSWFGILVTSAIMGNSVYRDFEHKTHALFFTSPISKWGYLGGRFWGSFVIALLVFSGMAFGYVFASAVAPLFPSVPADKFGPFNLMFYVMPYLLVVIPNLLFNGAIFFTLGTLTRNMLAVYIGSVLILVLYGVAGAFTEELDNEMLVSLLDPMGASAVYFTTRYWTAAEQNALFLPFSDFLVYNRLLWMGVGLVLLSFCFWRFGFSFFGAERKVRRIKKDNALGVTVPQKLALPKVGQEFSFAKSFGQYWKLTKLEFKGIVRSVYFIAILAAGVLFLLSAGSQVGKMYDTNTFPVTSEVLNILSGTFALFILIIITFYSGELVWRERDARMNQLYDALPIPNWVPFSSKLTALMGIQVILMAVILVCGVLLQALKGYFNFEISLYLKDLGMQLIGFWLMCVLAMLVQVLVNNKYLGHFIMVLYYLANIFKGQLGFEHLLYSYNSSPGRPYSDMNGFGHFIGPFLLYKVYWGAFAVLLALASNLLWVRGTEANIKGRFKLAALQVKRSSLFVLGASSAVFLVSGGFIFYNTNILHEYQDSDDLEKLSAKYEKTYKKYEDLPQPRIVDVYLETDLYPKEREFRFKGYYWLKNKTNVAIDSVHLLLDDNAVINKLEFARPAKTVLYDKEMGYHIFQLAQPLSPGDSVKLNLDLLYQTKGYKRRSYNTGIVYNGTFINSQLLPHIGYQDGFELSDDDSRRKNGLPPKERMAKVDDLKARHNTYLGNDADWITFETVVSTVPDQIALAPGYLQKEWTKDGRRYFHYKMDSKILNFYAFLSADYEVKKDKWIGTDGKPVAIEVYYQKGHEYNLDRMIKGVKKSLDYYTANFSPYQHRQVRILEFPGYATFAQSFPNTIPFSESIGFIADVDDKDPEDVDYPFYVTAHEVAHQWWAHQVIGGDVQGSTLMSETMSQYAALMVMKKEYGPERMRKFLKHEMDQYLIGRAGERKKELPLYLVENQQYIHYRKGSVVMYALADYIGEDKLNAALKEYVQQVAFQQAPFTNSIEFMTYIRKATPDSLQYLVDDMFESITLYENKATEATAAKQKDGSYKVTFTVDAKKFKADSLGNETLAKLHDYVDVAVMTRKKIDGHWQDVPLYMQKQKIKAGLNKLEVTVKEKPQKAGVDPFNKLIDRNPDDNMKDVEVKS